MIHASLVDWAFVVVALAWQLLAIWMLYESIVDQAFQWAQGTTGDAVIIAETRVRHEVFRIMKSLAALIAAIISMFADAGTHMFPDYQAVLGGMIVICIIGIFELSSDRIARMRVKQFNEELKQQKELSS